MTYKQIEAIREIRLWIGQVIIPAVSVGVALMANQDVRKKVSTKVEEVKTSIKKKKI